MLAGRTLTAEIGGTHWVDGLNEAQLRARTHLTPAELPDLWATTAARGLRARERMPRPVRALPLIRLQPKTWKPLSFLFDMGFTRDTWMHRIDLGRALGRPVPATAAHDGRIVADIVAEWSTTHTDPFTLHLTGPAGRRLQPHQRTHRRNRHHRRHRPVPDPVRPRHPHRRTAPPIPAVARRRGSCAQARSWAGSMPPGRGPVEVPPFYSRGPLLPLLVPGLVLRQVLIRGRRGRSFPWPAAGVVVRASLALTRSIRSAKLTRRSRPGAGRWATGSRWAAGA